MSMLNIQEQNEFVNELNKYITNYMENLYWKRKYLSLFGNIPNDITDYKTEFNKNSRRKFCNDLKKKLCDYEKFKEKDEQIENIDDIFDYVAKFKDILINTGSKKLIGTIKFKLYIFYNYEQIHGGRFDNLKYKCQKYYEQIFDKKIELDEDIIKYFIETETKDSIKNFITKQLSELIHNKINSKKISADELYKLCNSSNE